jgi:superfamily II DNA or RNA helicase
LVTDWDGGALPRDAHGVVVTYAQVGARPDDVARLATGGGALIDEIHHAGAERSWGDGLAAALESAGQRIALSGTPWRRDANPIPFVRYVDEVAQPDYQYGYARALQDGGVVRPVFFPRLGGHMEWVATDGGAMAATFDDPLDGKGSSQRLRTALAPEGGWLKAALVQAHERLRAVRADDPGAGGIVFAIDQDHARTVANVLHDLTGAKPVLAISDELDAHARLARFAHGDEPWAVCVRYASEGYDAPRLRVGVYATNVVAPLFWAQAVGRIVRWRPESGARQASWMFLPDDPRLRELALTVAEQRTHVLRRREEDEPLDEREAAAREADQLSLFAAVHSEAEGDLRGDQPGSLAGPGADPWRVPPMGSGDVDDPALEVELPPPPRAAAPAEADRPPDRALLRRLNSERVTLISKVSGMGHREINARLNNAAGIARITEATRAQLERRLREADRWLTRF